MVIQKNLSYCSPASPPPYWCRQTCVSLCLLIWFRWRWAVDCSLCTTLQDCWLPPDVDLHSNNKYQHAAPLFFLLSNGLWKHLISGYNLILVICIDSLLKKTNVAKKDASQQLLTFKQWRSTFPSSCPKASGSAVITAMQSLLRLSK